MYKYIEMHVCLIRHIITTLHGQRPPPACRSCRSCRSPPCLGGFQMFVFFPNVYYSILLWGLPNGL